MPTEGLQFGVHLPQLALDEQPVGLDRLIAVATAAERLGFGTLSANDHLVYGRPWLDGPVALASILTSAPSLRLMTSVSLPVVRGPVALAKALVRSISFRAAAWRRASGPDRRSPTTPSRGSRL